MNKTLATLLTAIIVGGGVYLWQQSQPESLTETTDDLLSKNEKLSDEIESTETIVNDQDDNNSSTLEGDYVNEKYGYSLDLSSSFKVYTEGYDNDGIEDKSTIWVGKKSDFWTDGFYIRVISDLDSRIDEVQQNVAEVIGQSKVTLGGQSATKVIVGWDIGYQVAYYFVETNHHIFEIQVVNSNDDAQDVVQTIQFAD